MADNTLLWVGVAGIVGWFVWEHLKSSSSPSSVVVSGTSNQSMSQVANGGANYVSVAGPDSLNNAYAQQMVPAITPAIASAMLASAKLAGEAKTTTGDTVAYVSSWTSYYQQATGSAFDWNKLLATGGGKITLVQFVQAASMVNLSNQA